MKHTLNFRYIAKIYGYIILTLGIAMLPAMLTSYIYEEYAIGHSFLFSGIIVMLLGVILIVFSRPQKTLLKIRDGYLIVGFTWIIVSLIGSLPYLISGYADSFSSAFFESTAGFTTTGATVFIVEVTPKGLLMWKAISHWLGGMGILVFMVSLMTGLGASGQKLFKAEFPSLSLDKLKSKISDSAKLLYFMYIIFTLLMFILLIFSKMNLFDALVTTMGCVSTSGLFAHSSGIAYFDSIYIETIIIIFTILSSISYSIYPLIIKGKFKAAFANKEVRTYLAIIITATLLVTLNLFFTETYGSLGEAFRYAAFYTASFSTTSGYNVVDYTSWPTFSLIIFLFLMFIGGCSSSTAGSSKVARIMVIFKLMYQTLYKRIHPHAVVSVKISGQYIPNQIISNVTSFMLSFLMLILGGAAVLSLQGFDFTTNISASLAMLANTGIYLGDFGSLGYYGVYCEPLKLVLSLLMIIGRLEVFSLLILCTPSFWHPDRAND